MSVQAPRCFQLSCLLLSFVLGAGSRVDAVVPIAALKHREALIVNPDNPIGSAIAPLSPHVNRIPINRIPTAIAPEFTSLIMARSPDRLELKRDELTQKPAAIVQDVTDTDAGTDADTDITNTETHVTRFEITESPILNPEAIATPVPAIPAAALDQPELAVTDTETLDLTEPVTPVTEIEAEENDLIDPDLKQEGDPELGILRLRQRPLQRPSKPKFVFLTGSFSYFRSDNILSSEIDTIGDQLLGGRLILSARPMIGPQTLLVGAIEGNLIRYSDLSDLDYNGFGLKAGIRHFWSRQAYSELTWDNRQLFLEADGDRFLNDHSFRLSMFYRVPLLPGLKLDNYYQFRWSVTDPTDRSRLVNRLGTVLDYDLTSTVQVSLNYQYDLTHFTQRDREDSYHQVIAQLGWDISRSIRLNIYGGYSFGASTASDINFNGSILGAGMSFNLPLF